MRKGTIKRIIVINGSRQTDENGYVMKFTERQLKLYAAPLSESENQKGKNAIGMVPDALKPLGF